MANRFHPDSGERLPRLRGTRRWMFLLHQRRDRQARMLFAAAAGDHRAGLKRLR